jgi:hypothetical protein
VAEAEGQGPGTTVPPEEAEQGRARDGEGNQPPPVGTPAKVVLPYTWFGQPNGYWCGPASTRMALGTRMKDPPSQQMLATFMGTDTGGTDHIGLPASALNKWLTPETKYVSRTITDPPTQAQRDLLKKDLVARISAGWPIVANVISGWRPPEYPTGTIYHYVAVVGYDDSGDKVLIADPAAAGSAGPRWVNVLKTYWITTKNLGTWIGGKGYTG